VHAPFVFPHRAGDRFYAAYAPPPLSLYGTAAILILAFTTRFCYRLCQLHGGLARD